MYFTIQSFVWCIRARRGDKIGLCQSHVFLAHFTNFQLKTLFVRENITVVHLYKKKYLLVRKCPIIIWYSNKFTWKVFVACVDGNMPWSLNNCMTNVRLCSNILRCPFSFSTVVADLCCCDGVLGVRGERSDSSERICCSILKSGGKKRLPIELNELADGVQDDIALSCSDCWSSSTKIRTEDKKPLLIIDFAIILTSLLL